MAKRRHRARWVEVFQSELPARARLVATLLDMHGLAARSARSRRKHSHPKLSLVRVAPNDAARARGILAQRRIENEAS